MSAIDTDSAQLTKALVDLTAAVASQAELMEALQAKQSDVLARLEKLKMSKAQNRGASQVPKKDLKCHRCQKKGHLARECLLKSSSSISRLHQYIGKLMAPSPVSHVLDVSVKEQEGSTRSLEANHAVMSTSLLETQKQLKAEMAAALQTSMTNMMGRPRGGTTGYARVADFRCYAC